MADNKKSVNLLPEYLRTSKNSKFLSSTIDQFIQTPELERVDGFVGSKDSLNFNPSVDLYLTDKDHLRNSYQLEPSAVLKDSSLNVKDVITFDDLINELTINGAKTDNLDRLFRSSFHSFDPLVDWDKLINYSNYYWLPTGPDTISIDNSEFDILTDLIGKTAFQLDYVDEDTGENYFISNGMCVVFSDSVESATVSIVAGRKYIVEGVGNSITLVDFDKLEVGEKFAQEFNETFDQTLFDSYPFDGDKRIPIDPEYITINKASNDLNSWSRYNRWFHEDVISITSKIGGILPDFSKFVRAERPIIEFIPNIQLFNFGTTGIKNVDLIDTTITDAFDVVEGAYGIYIDEVQLEKGQRIIFNADVNEAVRSKIYTVDIVRDKIAEIVSTATGAEIVINLTGAPFSLTALPVKKTISLFLNDSSIDDSSWEYDRSTGIITISDSVLLLDSVATDDYVSTSLGDIIRVEISQSLVLEEFSSSNDKDSLSINFGNTYGGSSWYFKEDTFSWTYAQQHMHLNQAPLFDLYNLSGDSYTKPLGVNDFAGTKVFGYAIGSGANDTVLGFPVTYKSGSGVGSFLFKNYFMEDEIYFTEDNVTNPILVGNNYLKVNNSDNTYSLVNVWKNAEGYQIPIIEIHAISESTSSVIVTSLDYPYDNSLNVVAYVNNVKTDMSMSIDRNISITFDNALSVNDVVKLLIYTRQSPNKNGYYESPLGLTNNPLNGSVVEMTLSDLSDHLSTMVSKINIDGVFPGKSNLRDLYDYTKYGTRFIVNTNPIIFSNIFLGKKEHNLIDAIRFISDQYNQFKMNLITSLVSVDDQMLPADALDYVLKNINKNKDNRSSYYRSDMLAYGSDKTTTEYTVGVVVNYTYPLPIEFSLDELSFKSVLVYLNDEQLVHGRDYTFDSIDNSINILLTLSKNDVIKICTYKNTAGAFIPPTPSKVGLYPKFVPEIVTDTTYSSGDVQMIRCHDGSMIVAFGDYRDAIILEYEKRVYNNIKVSYNSNIIDMKAVLPGAFRHDNYTKSDALDILRKDFIKWAGVYNVDVYTNDSFDESDTLTWNLKGSVDQIDGSIISGTWKSLYQYYYDTYRPHTHPWEMLGLTEKPDWWDSTYGVAPYKSSNTQLWTDLKNGYVRGTNEIKTNFVRPDLLSIIPVDSLGNLKVPYDFLVSDNSYQNKQSNWTFGDFSPAELAWRNSSYWPFSVNILAALFYPATYCSSLYDVSRTSFDNDNQLIYNNDLYINPNKLILETGTDQIAGYGTFVIEKGSQKNVNYVSELSEDLTNLNVNLVNKLGGFSSKDKLQVIIDTTDPTSSGQGAILPPEDYSLLLNVSNPIQSISISGIIIQKNNGNFLIKGYDKSEPFFNVLLPIKGSASGAVTVGGKSAQFTEWSNTTNNGNSGLDAIEKVSAQTNTTRYYKQGQIVRYNGKFYRVTVGHTAQPTFDDTLFQQLSSLPITGGASAQLPSTFSKKVVQIPYGTEYSTIQEVYDIIVGYGAWLESQGFIFDEYNTDLFEILDWKYTAKEFLFWTTQNWSNGHLITLSPFSNKLKYSYTNSIVDNVSSSKYEYSLLKADGTPFPADQFILTRDDGVCTIETTNSYDGLFFATLRSIQKEHVLVFNNTTIFNDIIYDIETGYRQKRLKYSGFRTANWNGDLYSPGFLFDAVDIIDWKPYVSFNPGKVVRYNGKYYEATEKISSSGTFDFTQWVKLREKPVPDLLPNFEYKINQFEDFYSLDIDNFDSAQQQLSQHLLGYTQRPYLTNIFTNPITQYKFYQGFIREKGTKNAIDKISKAGKFTRQGNIEFKEEWAFRIGHYGGFETFNEIEFPLEEGTSLENPYVVKFSNNVNDNTNKLIQYTSSTGLLIKPDNYLPSETFAVHQNDVFDSPYLKLNTAGYVRLDDVTSTAYNKNSLLDIANNSLIKEADTIWLGFLENDDWSVYRYSKQIVKISGVFVSAPNESITFSTTGHHNLEIGDIISVVNFNDQVNGVYIVQSIPELYQFTVASELGTIVNEPMLSYGSLFRFEKVRFSNFTELATNLNLSNFKEGEKIWIDSAPDKWAVYEKINNYKTGVNFDTYNSPSAQQLGYSIFSKEDSPVVIVSAPSWNVESSDSIGRVWSLEKYDDRIEKRYEFDLNSQDKTYCESNTSTGFGYSLNFDANKELYFVGAPLASNIRTDDTGVIVVSTGTETARTFAEQGIVKISTRNYQFDTINDEVVLAAPYAYSSTTGLAENSRFGSSIYINRVSAASSTTMLISAPGDGVTFAGSGNVFAYYVNVIDDTPRVEVTEHSSGILVESNITLSSGSKWGNKISGSDDGKFIAISAPGFVSSTYTGLVEIFDETLTHKQTIYSPGSNEFSFGDDIYVSSTGKFLFVSSVNYKNPGEGYGKVAVYKADSLTSSGTYSLHQLINNPITTNNLTFGHSISLSDDENVLVISSLGENRSKMVTFDVDAPSTETTFDQETTLFSSPIPDSGTVYVFNNLGDYFVQADELTDADIIEGSRYGKSVVANNDVVFVGAPWAVTAETDDDSTFFAFYKNDNTVNSWKLLRSQSDLVNTESIKRVTLIDTEKEDILEYLDVIDPLKGKIAGIAEQELTYKAPIDPAIYSIGVQGAVVDNDINWIDEQVGKLWWDLSTAKFTWYEQGDEIYRKNNWGKLFPGASIDVYEWVKSDLLPSEWAAQADTNEGLTNGISGQPKYPDNSVVSVKQVFNNVTNSFENVYYFWVKNKTTVPDIRNRRMSALQVSSIIADPAANGIKFVEILSPDSVAFANVQPMLKGNYISANITSDTSDLNIPRHTEWLLLEEGNRNNVPNTLLTKKLFDSLLGHDYTGKIVPDPELSYRNKFGISIRPQQTMFNDRLTALRNLVEFANSVLINNLITGNYSFDNLNSKEEIPTEFSRQYDYLVEDTTELSLVDTSKFRRATIECTSFNGKIVNAEITDPGAGYVIPPSITITSPNGSDAVILAELNSAGQLASLTIDNPGYGYTDINPTAVVRPHTVILRTNSNYGNRWSKHEYDYFLNEWFISKTQIYNTELYWNYVDWAKDTYDGYKEFKYVITDSYELSKIIDIEAGDYVKINNIGDGRYVILERVADNIVGDFSTAYNIVYSENGTIQILDTLWDYSQSKYSYDAASLEETLYDQIPDLELLYILTALKDDIFINELKVNWNLFFFKAVKYALTEQKVLDWAFKTSFINVTNTIGELSQPSIYRIDNEEYFEEYIKEVKPYRTKIRTYTSGYVVNDTFGLTGTPVTDFDLPSYFNSLTNEYLVVNLGNDKLLETPWNDWYNNYTYYVDSIEVADSGEGYSQVPTVTIEGGNGSGATAEAYIRNGSIFRIVVTDPGSGYTVTPRLVISGGGNVTRSATASVILSNDTIRKNKVGIKFDRVGTATEIGIKTITETFPPCTGYDTKFVLGWLAEPDKTTITPILDGKLVLATDYTIEYYYENNADYTKKYCRFVFLNYVPKQGQIFKITYNKNINLYTAVDRIENHYEPTDDMPGKDLSLLMAGAEFKGRQIQGLTFGYSPAWDQGLYDNDSAWADAVDQYANVKVVEDISYGTSTIYVDNVEDIVVGQRINITTTSTNYIRPDTVVTAVNTNSVEISNASFHIKKIDSKGTDTTSEILISTSDDFKSYLQPNDLVEIKNVDNGSVSGFDGLYTVTGIGNKKFTLLGTGSHYASTLSQLVVKSELTTASVAFVPSVTSDISHTSSYRIYYYEDSALSASGIDEFIELPMPAYSVDDVSNVTVFSTSFPGFLPVEGTVALGIEQYKLSVRPDNTYKLEVYNKNLTTYKVSVYGYPKLELWKDGLSQLSLDTEISAGSWNSTGNFVGALGVNPAEFVVNGAGFLTTDYSYAPEEQVKGQVFDSVSINVYTQNDDASGIAVNGAFPVDPNSSAIVNLGINLTDAVGILVHYNGEIFNRLYDPVNPTVTGPYFSPVPAVPRRPSGTAIATEAGDDTFTGPYSLGFEWNMFGTKYTEVYVGTNGYLTFGEGSDVWTPLGIDSLPVPSIMIEFCDLWQDYGSFEQGLESAEIPGLFFETGTVSRFKFWRLRFQGTHYDERTTLPYMPPYDYEVTLYSDGTNQYVEMIFENTWRNSHTLVPADIGFITGIASAFGIENVSVSWEDIQNNTSHVFYSTSNGGNWQYAGQGSFDPYKSPYTFTATNQFFVFGNDLYVAPQPVRGRAGYTILTMGGDHVIDNNMVVVENQPDVLISSAAYRNDVRSVYVTVNGKEIYETGDTYYTVVSAGVNNDRTAIIVYNIPDGVNTIQAWFLKTNHPKFNRMDEEIYPIVESTQTIILSNPPGVIEPVSSQVLVEITSPIGASSRRRLNPPFVSYYELGNTGYTFKIDNKNNRDPYSFTMDTVRVYGNGSLLRPGFDYTLDQVNNTITLISGILSEGDLLAIEGLNDYDYIISNGILRLQNSVSDSNIKVVSFTDHDNLMMRTDRYPGVATRRYILDLPAISENYIWVYVNGLPLTAGYDFELLADLRTVQLSEWVSSNTGDSILITTINSPSRTNTVLGYRIFKDIFERVTYTRISDFYSTRLSKELAFEDNEIHVYDASRLVPPNPYKNKPGVVFIDSERIEFFEKRDNILTQLRRSTMGTAPANFTEIGTKAIDQTEQQYILGSDEIRTVYHITSATTGTYVLNTVTSINNTYTFVINKTSFVYNTGTMFESRSSTGIELSTSSGINLSDEVIVKYGGRVLRKSSLVVHDTAISYNDTAESLVTIPPEFSITYNEDTGNQELHLNIDNMIPGVRIDIEQKIGRPWIDQGDTIFESESVQAKFIRAKPTELPDAYYYGGTPVLTDDNNFEITDDDNNPIEGY